MSLEVEITIPNWSKYNPRSDRKNYSWFRLQNDFFADSGVLMLSIPRKTVLLCILCEVSKASKGFQTISTSFMSRILGRREKLIIKDLEVLHDAGIIVCRHLVGSSRHSASFGRPTNVTNGTKRTLTGMGSEKKPKQVVKQNAQPSLLPEKNSSSAVSAYAAPLPKKSKFSSNTRSKMQGFIKVYADEYKKKYKAAPEGLRDKALIGKLGHWIETVSQDRACKMVQVFLQMQNKQFERSCHSPWDFFRNLNAIGIAVDVGSESDGRDWDKIYSGKT